MGLGAKVVDALVFEGSEFRERLGEYRNALQSVDGITSEIYFLQGFANRLPPISKELREQLISIATGTPTSLTLSPNCERQYVDAKEYLRASIEHGSSRTAEKQSLAARVGRFEGRYLGQELNLYGASRANVSFQNIRDQTNMLLDEMRGELKSRQPAFDEASTRLLKQGVRSVGVTAAVTLTSGYVIGRLGMLGRAVQRAGIAKKLAGL